MKPWDNTILKGKYARAKNMRQMTQDINTSFFDDKDAIGKDCHKKKECPLKGYAISPEKFG